jgi:transglutaminase-like putative cysteine protease
MNTIEHGIRRAARRTALRLLATTLAVAACATAEPRPAAPAFGKTATYEARNAFDFALPQDAKDARIWIVLPQEDPLQDVERLDVASPLPHETTTDAEGNRMLYVHGAPPAGGKFSVVTEFRLRRREQVSNVDASKTRPYTEEETRRFAADLAPNKNVAITDDIRATARSIVGDETNPVVKARRIYDWVLGNVDYWVKDPEHKKASPVGSAEYCMTTRTGNCTDFHSLYAALARSTGLATRMVYGTLFKSELDGKDKDASYHCWIEFWAPDIGWTPLDVALADIYAGDFATTDANAEKVRLTTSDGYRGPEPARVDAYFGGLDERRVTFSRGRDLTLSPPAAAGPVNHLPKCWVEVDGKPVAEGAGWTRKFTYRTAAPQ